MCVTVCLCFPALTYILKFNMFFHVYLTILLFGMYMFCMDKNIHICLGAKYFPENFHIVQNSMGTEC